MKNAILTLCLCAASLGLKAQITLTQKNMPLPSKGIYLPEVYSELSATQAPATGANQVWDYSNLQASFRSGTGLSPVQNASFSENCLEDTESLPLTPNASFYASAIYNQDSKGFYVPGYIIDQQNYGLNTGTPGDYLAIPSQVIKYDNRQNIIAYPATYQSKWTNTYTLSYNFEMTVAVYGLTDETFTKVAHITEYDSVAGWGNLIIPSANKASIGYPALLVMRKTVEQDSFYADNKQPAPSILLSYFGMVGNGQTTTHYEENFYGADRIFYLLSMDFGDDDSYTNPKTAWYSGYNITSGISEANKNDIHFTVYPNPAEQNTIHTILDKNSNTAWQLSVTNLLGQTVKDQTISGSGKMDINIDVNNLAKGLYMVNITDENGAMRASSKVEIR